MRQPTKTRYAHPRSIAIAVVMTAFAACPAAGAGADGGAAAPWPGTTITPAPAPPRAPLPQIVADPGLQRAVTVARERFLARQAFDRFDVTVLLEGRDGRWLRGAHGGDVLAYPASCVKLPYLVAAVHWCTLQGRAPDCLDADVRPMVVDSDNVATGRVVDALSGVPNVAWAGAADVPLPGSAGNTPRTSAPAPPDFAPWLERRRYTERLLDGAGLLAGQTLLNKTWPTNSGEAPEGYERLSLAVAGRNAMSPDAAARLMLALQTGAIAPAGRDHARSLLRRERWSGHAAFGSGLPPGTRLDAKTGTAYDTLEEIAAIQLTDGRRLVVAAFSNGWNPDDDPPFDVAPFGSFAEELLLALQEPGSDVPGARAAALPWSVRVGARPAGVWRPVSARGAYRAGAAWGTAESGATYEWRVTVPGPGRYELAVWYPAGADRTPAARYAIEGLEVPVYHDQRRWGARWLPLGVVDVRGTSVAVRVRADAPGLLVADTVRISAVPDDTAMTAAH